MNPRAPQKVVHFGEVALAEVFDLRGFNLNAKLDIDPDFWKQDDDHDDHDHEHGEHCDHPAPDMTRHWASPPCTMTM
jgi:G3E family GTPase